MKKLKEYNLNWDDYIIPSMDRKDVKIFHEILGDNFNYEQPDYSDVDESEMIFDNETKRTHWHLNSNNMEAADIHDEDVDAVDDAIKVWPEGYEMIKGMLDEFYPTYPMDDGNVLKSISIGCSCGIFGNRPFFEENEPPYAIGVMATVNGSVGAAEGLYHELGHCKTHALGIDLVEWTDDLIENSFEEVFHSPVRFDKKRPMGAVIHAEFSYIYVTEYYNQLFNYMKENDLEEFDSKPFGSYYGRQAYNLKRIGNGIHTIKENAKMTDEGDKYLKSMLDYATDVWYKGYKFFEENELLEDYDWEPEKGKP